MLFIVGLIFNLLLQIISLYIWALILGAVINTLMSFGVLDSRNRIVWTVADFLNRVTEPVLRPVRNALPNFGNVDLSPLVVILLLQYLAVPIIARTAVGVTTGYWQTGF